MSKIEAFRPNKNWQDKKIGVIISHPDDESVILRGVLECLC